MLKWQVHHLQELSGSRGDAVSVLGGGHVRNVTVEDVQYRYLEFAGALGGLPVPAAFPTLHGCVLSRWRVGHLDLGYVHLQECQLLDVDVAFNLGVGDVTMTNCTVTGTIHGNLRASRRRHGRIMGNDFSRARGLTFMDGVRWDENTFDHGGEQLVLERSDLDDPHVRDLCTAGEQGDLPVTSLAGRGPIALGQSWALIYRDDFPPQTWADLCTELPDRR